ncbi:MAG: family 43 glycosylhydrolase [Planctomycetota bacterium]|jgi:beta-xylosidase
MKTIILLTIIIAITISTVSHSAEAGRKDNRQPLTFCNPLNLQYRFTPGKSSRRMAADPVIVLFKDTYFLFSKGSSEYWYSSDLVNWILIPEEKSELPDHPTAPAVTVVGQEVYFIPSSKRTGLFYKSTDPKSGKWELAKKSIPTWDPALFCDDDGRAYYYWGCSNNAPIQGVELDKSGKETPGRKGIW